MFEQVWSGRQPVFDHFSETDLVGLEVNRSRFARSEPRLGGDFLVPAWVWWLTGPLPPRQYDRWQ